MSPQSFIPSPSFTGEKSGYVYTRRGNKQGYYLDPSSSSTSPPSNKRRKTNTDTVFSTSTSTPSSGPVDILSEAEAAASSRVILTTTLSGVKSTCLTLETLCTQNSTVRTAHSKSPDKWIASELALYDCLQSLSSSWGVMSPLIYPTVVELGAWDTVLSLITHPNLDVSLSATKVVYEMLGDPSAVVEGGEYCLLDGLVDSGGLEIITTNLSRCALEGEEGGGVEGEELISLSLEVVSSVVEVEKVRREQGVFEGWAGGVWEGFKGWGVGRCKDKGGNVEWIENQRSSAEVLSLLLSSLSTSPTLKITSSDVDGLLIAFSAFMRKEPEPGEEVEYLENLGVCLGVCASRDPGGFKKMEGVELACRVLPGKQHIAMPGLKIITSYVQSRETAEDAVEKGCLKSVGKIFMGRGKPRIVTGLKGKKMQREKRAWERDVEGLAVEVFYLLTRHLEGGSEGEFRERLIAKFLESDSERCERVVEVMIRNDERMRGEEVKYLRSEEADEDEKLGVDVQAKSFMRKMDGGGSVFFQASALAGWVCQNSRRGFEKIQESLGVRGSGMTLVREGIEEWGGMMEDGEEKGRLQGIRNDIG